MTLFQKWQSDGQETKQQEGDNSRPTALLIISWLGPDNGWPSMRWVMHGGFDGAHLCTVQSIALWRPCPVYRRWSSAGTGRHRSPHLSRTPAPRWQRWREWRLEHMLTPCRTLEQCLSKPCYKRVDQSNHFLSADGSHLGFIFLITVRRRTLAVGLAVHLNARSSKAAH